MAKKRKKNELNQKETTHNSHKEKKTFNDYVTDAENFSKKKYIRYGFITLLIIIAIIISAYVRLGTLTLPITDEWATNIVESNYKGALEQQIRAERPGLPETSVRRLVEEQYAQYYAENKDAIDAQKAQLSTQYKSVLQNDNGMTYLLGIDEYLFYSYAKWYERNGYFGTDIVDGEERFMLRNGRFGEPSRFQTHAFLISALHDVWRPFNSNFDIEWASFYITVVLIGLSAIPLFFLNKKISGTTGGFIATLLVLTAVPLVGRTLGGSSEDDVHTILFTFIMMALFVNALGQKTKNIAIMAAIAGLVNAIFMITWSGWWYGYLLVLGSAGLYVIFEFVRSKLEKKTLTRNDWIQNSAFVVVFFVSAVIFSMIVALLLNGNPGASATNVITAPANPLRLVLQLEAGADLNVGAGEYPLWPNVLRTVAELNSASVTQIIGGAGTIGNTAILMFYLAVLGIISLFLRYKENPNYVLFGIILFVWTVGMIFVATSAVRFILMATIPILIAVGALIGYIMGPVATYVSRETTIRKSIYLTVMFLILTPLLLWSAVADARNVSEGAIPLFDDAWYDSVYAMRDDAGDERGVVSSWWDYGHFFQAYGEQTVTFDGGDQGKRIYWMGRSLLTDDVEESVNILKVMNCGQERPYDLLEAEMDKYKATQIKLEIAQMTREEARARLSAENLSEELIEEVLGLTHCDDLLPMYYITSEDMVGKAPVWAHFGGWNFTRAYFYYYMQHLPVPQMLSTAQENLNMSETQARALYNEARLLRNEDAAAQWISPYVSYTTRTKTACREANNTITCDYNIGLQQDATSTLVLRRAIVPLNNLEETQIVLQTVNRATGTALGQNIIKPANVIIERNGEFEEHNFGEGAGFDLILMAEGPQYTSLLSAPELSKSIFTRLFFMEGRGEDLTMFERVSDTTSFRGERIIVWKVNP